MFISVIGAILRSVGESWLEQGQRNCNSCLMVLIIKAYNAFKYIIYIYSKLIRERSTIGSLIVTKLPTRELYILNSQISPNP